MAQFEKGHTRGFTKENPPQNRRKRDTIRTMMQGIGDEIIEVELVKGHGKVKITRMEAMIRGMFQRATSKSDVAAKELLDRLYGKVKDRIELSEKNELGGILGEAKKMKAAELMAAYPHLFFPQTEKAEFEEILPEILQIGESEKIIEDKS